MRCSIYSVVFAAIFVASTLAQGPGNGVAKGTYASSNPVVGLEWMLKYLPTTAAEDSCSSNYCKAGSFPDGEKWQGRAQLVQPFTGMITRNCQLFSKFSTYKAVSGAVNLVAATSKGSDCGYYQGYAFDTTTATPIHATFAHNQDTCCKACAATKGCTGATYSPEVSTGRRLLQPMPGEGFGLHLVNVVASSTTGGLSIAELEDKYTDRLGDFSSFDPFMDYSIQLFTANLPAYAAAFAKDEVPHLLASWPAGSGSTWYSIFVRVPGSQMILELQGRDHPDGSVALGGGSALLPLESRMSPRNVALYTKYVKDKNNLLYAAGVSRATSNMTSVEEFYLNVLKASSTQSLDISGVSRRCFKWATSQSDVCFTQRPDTQLQAGGFDVKAMEANMWAVHAKNLKAPSNGDKYNDNHYAVDCQTSGDFLATYFTKNNPYPLSKASTFAFSCAQDYIIDPTGWTIQVDLRFQTSYPGCGWKSGTSGPTSLVQPITQ